MYINIIIIKCNKQIFKGNNDFKMLLFRILLKCWL